MKSKEIMVDEHMKGGRGREKGREEKREEVR